MKSLKGLNEKVTHFDEMAPKEVRDALPTVRSMLVNALGASPADNGDMALGMFDLGLKIKKFEGDVINVEDAEFALLQRVIARNAVGWVAHYLAQVLLKLKEADTKQKEGGK